DRQDLAGEGLKARVLAALGLRLHERRHLLVRLHLDAHVGAVEGQSLQRRELLEHLLAELSGRGGESGAPTWAMAASLAMERMWSSILCWAKSRTCGLAARWSARRAIRSSVESPRAVSWTTMSSDSGAIAAAPFDTPTPVPRLGPSRSPGRRRARAQRRRTGCRGRRSSSRRSRPARAQSAHKRCRG